MTPRRSSWWTGCSRRATRRCGSGWRARRRATRSSPKSSRGTSSPTSPGEIPTTVRALLAARIDALPAIERRVLRHASVVGRTFWPPALETDLELGPPLRELEARGFVVPRATSTLPGHTELAFVHGLTREVAYHSIPRADRCRTHASVARWIEARVGDRREEFIELLAYHYEAAARPADAALAWPDEPAEREAVRTAALRALVDAGDAARRRMAIDQAARFADRALALALTDAERLPALELKGRSFQEAVRGDDALAAFTEAIEVAGPDRRPRRGHADAQSRDPAVHALRRRVPPRRVGRQGGGAGRGRPRRRRRRAGQLRRGRVAGRPVVGHAPVGDARVHGPAPPLAGGGQARRRARGRDRRGDRLLAAAGLRAGGLHVAVLRRGSPGRRRARRAPAERRRRPDRPGRGAREPGRGRHVLRPRRPVRPGARGRHRGVAAGAPARPAPAAARGRRRGPRARAVGRVRRAADRDVRQSSSSPARRARRARRRSSAWPDARWRCGRPATERPRSRPRCCRSSRLRAIR